jgi:hypothetical protein
MTVFALSPAAYRGLLELAANSIWCADYDRILRYLAVVEAATEAKRISGDATIIAEPFAGWGLVSFLESAEHFYIPRPE